MSTRMIDPATLRLAAVVASSEDAIITTSSDGTIETWNRAAERLFGYSASEAIGRSIDIIVPADVRAQEHDHVLELRQGQPASHFETVGLSKQGERVALSVSVSPVMTPDGEVIGVARIARDISTH